MWGRSAGPIPHDPAPEAEAEISMGQNAGEITELKWVDSIVLKWKVFELRVVRYDLVEVLDSKLGMFTGSSHTQRHDNSVE